MRVPLIAGNWKMNMTIPEAVELVNGIKIGLRWPEDVDVRDPFSRPFDQL